MLTQVQFAKPLGIKGAYVSDIEKGKSSPSESVLILMEMNYRLNRDWLMTGEGDPYIKDKGEDQVILYTAKDEPIAEHGQDASVKVGAITKAEAARRKTAAKAEGKYSRVDDIPEGKIKVSEALTMAARVLESGTSYANALYLNIQHFDRAIQTEQRLSSFETELREMRAEIANLKAVQTTLSHIKKIHAKHAAPEGVQEQRGIMKDLDQILDIANAPENTNHTGLPETVLEDDRLL